MSPDRPGPETSIQERERAESLAGSVGVVLWDLAAIMLLESVKGFGPQKFKEMAAAGVDAITVSGSPSDLPAKGKRGDELRRRVAGLTKKDRDLAVSRAARQIVRAAENDARILTYAHKDYPHNVLESNNPVPIIYVRGPLNNLRPPQAIACVGSRDIRLPYSARHHAFASFAADAGFTVVSGFATGADRIGHEAAHQAAGITLLVMPCGLDRPFPPENKDLWNLLMAYPKATAVSEFPFGTSASALTLRKRNKLIVAFAQGVMVSQSSAKGGAMNAWRFALEQRKASATFAGDDSKDTTGNTEMARFEEPPPKSGRLRRPPRPPATVFPADRDDPEGWSRWLRGLWS